jgi:hypothetical protein
MKYCALATMGFALAFGFPTASSFFVGMVAFSTAAQADIACLKLGCRETGRTLRRNGSYYRGLGLPAGYHQARGTSVAIDKKLLQPR